jgi:hypothetical protein
VALADPRSGKANHTSYHDTLAGGIRHPAGVPTAPGDTIGNAIAS